MKSGTLLSQVACCTKPLEVKSTDMHCILATKINISLGESTTRGENARSSPRQCVPATKPAHLQKVTQSGTKLVIFLGALCAQTNLFWREMKIKKMYLKSNTQQENFRTFEERDILNGIKSDLLPAKKTSLREIVLPVKSLCVLSCENCKFLLYQKTFSISIIIPFSHVFNVLMITISDPPSRTLTQTNLYLLVCSSNFA